MNSRVVEKKFACDAHCWTRWKDFDARLAPQSMGVYTFRVAAGAAIERVKGASDLIYVGSGKIRDRLRAHANPDWTNWDDSGWLISLIAQERDLELAWKELPEGEARSLESGILRDYLVQHFELPPANRRKPEFSPETRASIMLYSLSPEKRKQVLQQMSIPGQLKT